MKKIIYALALCCALQSALFSQIHLEGFAADKINPNILTHTWPARWISVPGRPANAYGVYNYRKSFDIAEVPQKFVVHVSADNRYKLFINGKEILQGPARCDLENWNFETVDIAPYLQKGKNTLSAVVWNYADMKPLAQMSYDRTEFIVQGDTENEAVVNTNDTWLCAKDEAYSPCFGNIPGYYVCGPGELFDASKYPWGWQEVGFDDSSWKKAAQGMHGVAKGGMDYPGRMLVPSPIPQMESKTERLAAVREASGAELGQGFIDGKESVVIPPHTEAHFILDNGELTNGYLNLLFSKGKGAEIKIGYTEAYYSNPQRGEKGNRNDIAGKKFMGYEDKIIADGGDNRNFTTLWWRTWRYLDITVKTADEALVLQDIFGMYSAYPFEKESEFNAPNDMADLEKMLEIGWRTARLCANETYMDCPYYEQLQYFGDTRIQTMVSMYNTRDTRMVKNAIEQGRQSMNAEGFTMSRYPTNGRQYIPSFSLWWIGIGHDYWIYRGDEAYLKSLLPAYRSIISWYENQLDADYSLKKIPYWFFVDWADGYAATNGEPIRDENGTSAVQDIIFITALDYVAQMEESFGMPQLAEHYKSLSGKMKDAFKKKYWDDTRKLFADTPDRRSYSQHANSLAVLAGLVEGDEAATVMKNTLAEPDLIQATIYFRYYVNQALNKAGLGDMLLDNLQIWKDQMALGLTTWAERPEPSRSDCHAWGASPNVEFFRTVLGIDSAAPAFKRVRIAPSLGGMKTASGAIPHPDGTVSVAYQVDDGGGVVAEIELPETTDGVFVWQGKEYPLKGGRQTLEISNKSAR